LWFFNLPQKWNNGMMEHWNFGFQKDKSHFNFILKPVGGGTINLTLHYSRPIIPQFRYSIIPIVSEAD